MGGLTSSRLDVASCSRCLSLRVWVWYREKRRMGRREGGSSVARKGSGSVQEVRPSATPAARVGRRLAYWTRRNRKGAFQASHPGSDRPSIALLRQLPFDPGAFFEAMTGADSGFSPPINHLGPARRPSAPVNDVKNHLRETAISAWTFASVRRPCHDP